MIMLEGREVKQSKIDAVKNLAGLIRKYRVIGVLSLNKTPSAVLQNMKSKLKDKMLVMVAKKSTILFALDQVDKKDLKKFVDVSPALLLTNEDPFKLYLSLEKNKSIIYAKPGDIALQDVEVKAGPTDLPPGPAISTLAKIKLPAKVQGPTISIIRDRVVCKAGEEINIDIASVLRLLKIKTQKVGLNVVVMDEEGRLYTNEQLYIDEERLLSDINIASMNALNLSLNIDYPTKENIQIMFMMAHLNAKQLQNEIGIEKKGEKEQSAEPEKPEEQKKEETEKQEEQKE